MQFTRTHYIRIRYHGPTNTRDSRLSATWEGWATDDSRPVRRYFAYTYDREDMARQVADMFCAWLSEGVAGTYVPDSASLADAGPTDWSLHVKTRRITEED